MPGVREILLDDTTSLRREASSCPGPAKERMKGHGVAETDSRTRSRCGKITLMSTDPDDLVSWTRRQFEENLCSPAYVRVTSDDKVSVQLLARLRRERREPVVIATKAGRRLSPHTADGHNRANLTAFVERSLRNLQDDVLDFGPAALPADGRLLPARGLCRDGRSGQGGQDPALRCQRRARGGCVQGHPRSNRHLRWREGREILRVGGTEAFSNVETPLRFTCARHDDFRTRFAISPGLPPASAGA